MRAGAGAGALLADRRTVEAAMCEDLDGECQSRSGRPRWTSASSQRARWKRKRTRQKAIGLNPACVFGVSGHSSSLPSCDLEAIRVEYTRHHHQSPSLASRRRLAIPPNPCRRRRAAYSPPMRARCRRRCCRRHHPTRDALVLPEASLSGAAASWVSCERGRGSAHVFAAPSPPAIRMRRPAVRRSHPRQRRKLRDAA